MSTPVATHVVGATVFWEFQLAEVMAVKEGRVTEVSTGYIRVSGYDFSDRVFPVTMPGKRLSDQFLGQKQRLRAVSDPLNLNWPDIHRAYVAAWATAMHKLHDDQAIAQAFTDIAHFTDAFIEAVHAASELRVHGVKLFRT